MAKGAMGKSDFRRTYGQSGPADMNESTAYGWGAEPKTIMGTGAYLAPAPAVEDGSQAPTKGGGMGYGEAAAAVNPWALGAAKGKALDGGKGSGGAGKSWDGQWAVVPFGPWGKAAGAWGVQGKAGAWPQEEEKYEGLRALVRESVIPVADQEEKWTADEIVSRMVTYITKAADQYAKDERLQQRGSPLQAQAVVEEFVEAAMGSMSQGCYDRDWFQQANFVAPLCLIADIIFKTAKLFSRMLAPMLHKYVEDALFRFREEERIGKAIWEIIENSGLPESYHKKCRTNLTKAYDDAHVSAAYGESVAEKAELGLLQDFVKGWISEFVGRGWDVLENGVGGREEQVSFVTKMFQTLTHPERPCLPHDLVAALDNPPPANWPFIVEATISVFTDMDNQPKKQKKGQAWWG